LGSAVRKICLADKWQNRYKPMMHMIYIIANFKGVPSSQMSEAVS